MAVLGLTFKRDSDDLRDSLAPKLVRLLERELAAVVAHDPHAPVATESLDEALHGADAVVVATNHSEFADPRTLTALAERTRGDCLVVDPWNAFGGAQVFASASETVERSNTQTSVAPSGRP